MKRHLVHRAARAIVLLCCVTAGAAEPPPSIGHAAQLARLALPAPRTLEVRSPAFADGGALPLRNTQYGDNVFPGLRWSAGPRATRSYAVIVQGEGLAGAPTSIHLTLYNLPRDTRSLPSGMGDAPAGASFGPNVHGPQAPYAGPHPHTAVRQRYHLQVFALDTVITAAPAPGFEALEAAMRGHVLASGETTAVAGKPADAPP